MLEMMSSTANTPGTLVAECISIADNLMMHRTFTADAEVGLSHLCRKAPMWSSDWAIAAVAASWWELAL